MKLNFLYALGFVLFFGGFTSCSDDDGETINPDPENDLTAEVMTNYADMALAGYQGALDDAKSLKTVIDAFAADPTQANFDAAKKAWKESRETYGPTEAFRFANGPIDSGDTEEIEGLLNSWPMDEAFVDYVDGAPNAGIINSTEAFPTLSKEVLMAQNGNNGEENVSIGYHAIEFLLWGQDLTAPSENLPGQRPYTDFVDGGTAANQERRREYLSICADLLVEDLQTIVDQWEGPYKSKYLALPEDEAISNIVESLAELSRSELAVERIAVALDNQDQEDEHSCFSDNTDRDIRLNLEGIVNIYSGKFAGVNGTSLKELISENDAELGNELNDLLREAEEKVEATDSPFDLAIAGGATSEKGAKVQDAVKALKAFGDKLLDAKIALELQ